MEIFETFECSHQNLSNSLCQFWNFSPNFVSLFSFMTHNSSVLFQLKQYILCSKGAHWNENFWDFQLLGSKFIKLLKSILKWQVNSSSNFESFFIVMTHNSPVDFELILFLLWIKGFHQYLNLEPLNFSGENLPYS